MIEPTGDSEICLSVTAVVDISKFSSFTKLKRVTAWILQFVNNCRENGQKEHSYLTTTELENYWLHVAQSNHFMEEIELLKIRNALPRSSCLLHLHPLLRVGGREEITKTSSIQLSFLETP